MSYKSRKLTNKNFILDLGTDNRCPVYIADYNKLRDDLLDIAPSDGTGTFDTINEDTAGSGVTIEGVLLKDNGISIATATTGAGWDVGTLFEHGSMTTPIAHGTVSANDLVLDLKAISATATGQWVVGDITYLESAGASTGYFLGGYNYINIAHNAGAAIASYSEVDMAGACALSGNVQGLYSEMIVGASGVITGAGKISGLTVEMNVAVGATVANHIYGIEVDMRDIKVDTAGDKVGIKVTMANGTGFLDYGMQFSNEFSTTTAVVHFDLTQGNAPVGLLFESGGHITGTVIKLTGAHTNLLTLPAAGTAPVIANALIPAAAPDATTMGADACIVVDVNGTPMYIPLYDTLHA